MDILRWCLRIWSLRIWSLRIWSLHIRSRLTAAVGQLLEHGPAGLSRPVEVDDAEDYRDYRIGEDAGPFPPRGEFFRLDPVPQQEAVQCRLECLRQPLRGPVRPQHHLQLVEEGGEAIGPDGVRVPHRRQQRLPEPRMLG